MPANKYESSNQENISQSIQMTYQPLGTIPIKTYNRLTKIAFINSLQKTILEYFKTAMVFLALAVFSVANYKYSILPGIYYQVFHIVFSIILLSLYLKMVLINAEKLRSEYLHAYFHDNQNS